MEILIARNTDQLKLAFERLRMASVIGCDTETSSLSARTGRLFSIQMSDGKFSVLIPVSEGIGAGPLAALLADEAILKIFHNARFDVEFLATNGYPTKKVFCTMAAEKMITQGANQSASLAETLYRYFAIDLDKSPRSQFTRNWDGIWTDELVHYALADVVHLPALYREQSAWLTKLGLADAFSERNQTRL